MKPYRYFKTVAKIGLAGSLLKSMIAFLFVTLIPNLIFLLPNKLNINTNQFIIILSVSSFIIIPCFKLGAIGFLIDSLKREKPSLGNIFDGFMYILKLIPLTILKIIACLPFIIVIYIAYKSISPETIDIFTKYISNPMENINLLSTISDKDYMIILFSEIGSLIALLLMLIINCYLAFTNYILYSEKLSGIKAVIKSIKLMKGNILYYIGFNLSFIVWYILSAFTMGYSDLYLNPYKEASFILFYDYLTNSEESILQNKEQTEEE